MMVYKKWWAVIVSCGVARCEITANASKLSCALPFYPGG